MNKDFAQGLVDGHADGQTGDNRLPSRALKRLFQSDQLLPGATNRHDQYRKGYVQGNEDEGRLRSAAASVNQRSLSKEMSMSTQDLRHSVPQSMHNILSNQAPGVGGGFSTGGHSIEEQLQLLHRMREYLHTLNEFLDKQSNVYQSRVDQVGGEGLLREMHNEIDNDMQHTRQRLRQMILEIESNDMATVSRWINKLESLL